jgi:hypothetical protein
LSVYDVSNTVSSVVLFGSLFGFFVFFLAAFRARASGGLRRVAALALGAVAYGWNLSILIVGRPQHQVLALLGLGAALAAAVVVARAPDSKAREGAQLLSRPWFRFAVTTAVWTGLLASVWRAIGFPPAAERATPRESGFVMPSAHQCVARESRSSSTVSQRVISPIRPDW